MSPTVTITPGPMDETRCTFTASRPIYDGEPTVFACGDTPDAPLAQAILAVPGVDGVEFSADAFTVIKRSDVSWEELEDPLRYAVTAALEHSPGGADAARSAPGWEDPTNDDELYEMVSEIFEREINPSVASHGGRVELIDVQDATVIVRMQGGCQGCGMANVTLRQGIEGSLRRAFPDLRGVEDITDHSAGTNPYYAAQK